MRITMTIAEAGIRIEQAQHLLRQALDYGADQNQHLDLAPIVGDLEVIRARIRRAEWAAD